MKVRIGFCLVAAILLFSGASPWEGAAAVAPEGELPATGRYVATNAFPVNTIVDITNIESGKSTRAIVANILNSPGLLAVVSFEAAELIGMRPGSVGRIRMVQPSDPIAYQRFTEGVHSDIPNYDSGNVLTEEQLLNELYRTDTYKPPSGSEGQITQADGTRGPSYTLEDEWRNRDRIVDVPGYNNYPPLERPPDTAQTPADQTPGTTQEQRVPAAVAEQPRNEIIKELVDRIEERPSDEIIKEITSSLPEVPANEAQKDISEYLAELLREEAAKEIAERNSVPEKTETPAGDTQSGAKMVPFVERPPPSASTVPPTPQQARPTFVDSAYPALARYQKRELDPGRYYVQLAIVNTPESVESTISHMVRQTDGMFDKYKPVVYRENDNRYRILLGSFNQGESAAVLARFKSFGWTDAFVRR